MGRDREFDPASRFPDDTPLGLVRKYVVERIRRPEGVDCPACGGHQRVYVTRMPRRALETLLVLYERGGSSPLKVTALKKEFKGNGGSLSTLAWWGLVAEARDEAGVVRQGWWYVTPLGVEFLHGRAMVQESVVRYAQRTLRREGPMVTFVEALSSAEPGRTDAPGDASLAELIPRAADP